MSARECRRMRIKMKNDKRYRRKDPIAAARRDAAQALKEKQMAGRKMGKK